MHKWSMSAKLLGGFMGLAGCLGALGLVSLWAVSSLRDDLGDVGQKILRKSAGSPEAFRSYTWTVRAEMRATLMNAALRRPQDLQKARNNGEQAFTRLDAALQELRPLLVDEKGHKEAAAGIAAMLPRWKDAFS